MIQPLRIDYVSDVACPWCAVGLHGLEEALRRAAGSIEADITFQPFELNPELAAGGVNHHEHIGGKFGLSAEQLAASSKALHDRAASVGFEINSTPASRIYNTFDAHRLLHWAREQGKQQALKHALLKANFTDNLDVSNPEVLATLAASAGLDPQAARAVLESGRFSREVREAEQLWQSRGVRAVPGIVINGKWLISGGQTPEIFEQALRNIAMELQAAEPT